MKFNEVWENFKNRKYQIETVVKFAIQTGMLELNALDGVAIHYKDNRVKEVHIDDFINILLLDDKEYSEMCKGMLFSIAEANLIREKK